MAQECAVILIDSGFDLDSIGMVNKLVAVCDLNPDEAAVGEPYLSSSDSRVTAFAHDPVKHGSTVLRRLMEANPELPVILIRAFDDDVNLLKTQWENGHISRPGWTDALRWAVNLLKERGMTSVANCSFGGFEHAMDGTGWESHSLRQITGEGKPGHIVIAAAGPGDSRAVRASWKVAAGQEVTVPAKQAQTATYNFWSDTTEDGDWVLEVYAAGKLHSRHVGRQIATNMWNGRHQVKVTVDGEADVALKVIRPQGDHNRQDVISFDCWVTESPGAKFLAHVNSELLPEPAVFPHVIAVGFANGQYSSQQRQLGGKPDVLVEGDGQISFTLPRVTALAASWLAADPTLDAVAVRERLGKFPTLG